jgi:hypothetical protein
VAQAQPGERGGGGGIGPQAPAADEVGQEDVPSLPGTTAAASSRRPAIADVVRPGRECREPGERAAPGEDEAATDTGRLTG